ncbi:GNAT family N-acetyltransferase [Nocardia veterana]|uniref:GNAT family N-acetyltransferase n=1 Tax=Nocardia veterana TaxID=132249 RepID=A0A7X6LWN5_9NOCA|nr:GNAT family N-acetyltransferase [Nocardia veterana]NKY85300.1 GNAT family N-acetyltransferase [Nocardia veterana]
MAGVHPEDTIVTRQPNHRRRCHAAVTTYIATHLARAHRYGPGPSSSWFRTGAPSEELNGVLRLNRADATEAERLRQLFGDVPACWHVWRDIDPPEIPRLLRHQGLEPFEIEPLMEFGGPGRAVDAERGHPGRIEEVADDTGLAEWAAVWSGAQNFAALVPGLREGMDRASTRYLLWREDGEALGCAAVVICSAGASLEHIVTRADHRGRGIGTALTRHALRLALAAGARRVVLTASADGEGIYRRLGFDTVGYVERYA